MQPCHLMTAVQQCSESSSRDKVIHGAIKFDDGCAVGADKWKLPNNTHRKRELLLSGNSKVIYNKNKSKSCHAAVEMSRFIGVAPKYNQFARTVYVSDQ